MPFEHKVRWMSALINPRQLTELKSRFKNDINSKRKYSQVNNFLDLVGILIVRGIISYEDFTILNQICQEYFKINFSGIPDSLTNAMPTNAPGSHQSFFSAATRPMQPSEFTNRNYASEGNSEERNSRAIPLEVIDIIIAGNITDKQWRPFARALNVDSESLAHTTNNADKVRRALTTFFQNTEQHRQWNLLDVALEKIRRIDLREQCRALHR